jgi:hypothetical protein
VGQRSQIVGVFNRPRRVECCPASGFREHCTRWSVEIVEHERDHAAVIRCIRSECECSPVVAQGFVHFAELVQHAGEIDQRASVVGVEREGMPQLHFRSCQLPELLLDPAEVRVCDHGVGFDPAGFLVAFARLCEPSAALVNYTEIDQRCGQLRIELCGVCEVNGGFIQLTA